MIVFRRNKLLFENINISVNYKGVKQTNEGLVCELDYELMSNICFEILKQTGEKMKADEKVRKWWFQENQLLNNILTIKNNFKYLEIEKDNLLNTELEDYQKQAVMMASIVDCIIGYDRGLGKSLIALNVAKILSATKVLIVCPSYLKFSWVDEIEKWTNFSYQIINGTKTQREQQYCSYFNNNKNILIVNYEQLRYSKATKNIHRSILETKFDLCICDESHRLKGRTSQTSEGILFLRKQQIFKRLIMLTGTPITKCESELFRLLQILNPQRFTSYWSFVDRYMDVKDGFFGKEIIGLKDKEGYNKIIDRYMIRYLKEDVADLPEKIIKKIYVEMIRKQLKIYKQAEKEYLNPVNEVIESDIERFIRLLQISQNPAIVNGENISCIEPAIHDILEDIGNVRVIIACTYINMSKLLTTNLQAKYKKRNIHTINGSVNVKKRNDIITQFKNSTNDIIVTTIKALSEGVNLDCCNNIIMCDIDFNCGVNDQFMDRIHRMTSTQIKYYYNIIVKNSVHNLKYKKIMNEQYRMSYALNDSKRAIKYLIEEYKASI